MTPSKLLLLVSLCSSTIGTSQNSLRLELASVVFRHGDRSPVGTFPKDRYHEADWPQGYGQLSITGMKQHQQLGELLRQRYVTTTFPNFLNENYTRVQVRVRSTDVDRTLMSASTMLSALFPADDSSERFNQSLFWQPIPVHTEPVEEDRLLRGYNDCPRYSDLRLADKQTKDYQRVENDNKALFNALSSDTGLSPVSLSNIWTIEDSVYIQEFFAHIENMTDLCTVNLTNIKHIWNIIFVENITLGKESPLWANTTVMNQLKNLSDFTLSLMFNTKEKNRLTAGVWLNKLLGDMKNKANQTDKDSKLFLYSAHDTTVACMLAAFGLFNNKQPPYATAFIVELFSDTSGHYYVQFLLRVGPDSTNINLLKLDQCPNKANCTLSEFEQFVEPLIPNNIVDECNHGSSPPQVVIAFIVVGSVMLIGLIVLSVVLGVMCYKRKREATYKRLRTVLNSSNKV